MPKKSQKSQKEKMAQVVALLEERYPSSECALEYEPLSCIVDKKSASSIEYSVELPEALTAPVKKGDIIGKIKYSTGGNEIGSINIYAKEDIGKIRFYDVFLMIICAISIN